MVKRNNVTKVNNFSNPKQTADEMINIISPLFNAGKTIKLGIGVQIGLKSDEKVDEYLTDVLRCLTKAYKK